jgi:hypothetical protein
MKMLNIPQAVEAWTVMDTDGKYEFVITFLSSMDFSPLTRQFS